MAVSMTLTGPGCPDCDANNENPILATMYANDDCMACFESERYDDHIHDENVTVGYEVKCRRCGLIWDEWLSSDYGIVR